MKKNKVFIIYGAGKFGKILYLWLYNRGIYIDFFCQSQKAEYDSIEGVSVLDMSQLLKLEGKVVVFIAIDDPFVSNKIKNKLRAALKKNMEIYSCGNFIRQNIDVLPFDNGRINVEQGTEKRYCMFCETEVETFLPYDIEAEVFRKHHVIAGGPRNQVFCPYCGSKDRERWQAYVIKNYTKILSEKCTVLHFAPEKSLAGEMASNRECNRFTGDIMPDRANNMIDVTDIPFRDSTFDYIIINHVMSYIKNERKAMHELRRVLKQTGKLLISFAICADQETFEDESILTAKGRLDAYGDSNMVRIYGKDYQSRLGAYGFYVKVYTPKNLLSTKEIVRNGYIADDIMIICTKDKL